MTWSERLEPVIIAAFFVPALLLGGAGASYPLVALSIELLATAALAFLLSTGRPWQRLARAPAALVLVGVVAAFPLVQLIPLPPSIWSNLPGRDVERQVLMLVGKPGEWMPVTLDSEATWLSFLALFPGMTAFVAACSGRTRQSIAWMIAGAALVSALMGALQALRPELHLWAAPNDAVSPGLFTNRNHQALLMNIGIIFVAALASVRGTASSRLAGAALVAFLAASVVLTRSRSGAALMLLSIPFALVWLTRVRVSVRGFTTALAGIALVALLLLITPAGQLVVDRFASLADARFGYWADTWVAVKQYWPVGTGLGTFDTIYQSVESLANVSSVFANHAHNDYLELLLEGGLAALALLVLGLLVIGRAAFAALRAGKREDRLVAAAASVAIASVLLHSIVDYPLRMAMLMTIFGACCGLIVAISIEARSRTA